MYTDIRRAAVAVALIATASCTVHNTEPPGLTGPSTFATSFTLTASPDVIAQDGFAQSTIRVMVIGPDGKPAAGDLRMDMAVNGVTQDFGALDTRTISTRDGVATVRYTAPPSPPNGVFGTCGGVPGNCVEILATRSGTNFQTAITESVRIRLVPTGVILPPAGSPTAAFTMSPTPPLMNVPITFDASSSAAGVGAGGIVSFAWTFGDGGTGTGQTVTHTFGSQQIFNVMLTVTNDRSLAASTQVPVAVGTVTAPTPVFVFSPSAPQVGQTVSFNAGPSVAAPGHPITSYSWNFGDGATASGVTASHIFAVTGTYAVVLTVRDDTGQQATNTTPVDVGIVGGGGGGGAPSPPTATFTFGPPNPSVNEVVSFNATTSAAGAGRSIASYVWNFGDGTAPGAGVTPTHAFTTAATYPVTVTVTDNGVPALSTTSASVGVTVGAPQAPTANFTFSPATPGRNDQVVFDASSSTQAGAGQPIVDVAWNFGDGTAVIHCNAVGGPVPPATATDCPNASNIRISAHTFITNQNFIVNLVVTDSVGRIGSRNVSVNVALASPTVAVTASPSSPNPGQSVSFNSSASTYFPGSGPTSYVWSFGDGGTCSTASFPVGCGAGSAANPTHTYAGIGTFGVNLSITDNTACGAPRCPPGTPGRTGTGGTTVAVVAVTPPASPIAAFTFSPPSPSISGASNTVSFDGTTSSTPSGAPINNYRWNFGDGTIISGAPAGAAPAPGGTFSAPRHTYVAAGAYTVTLTVTDTNALTGSTTGTVTVLP
jgi:PKD repeat protein